MHSSSWSIYSSVGVYMQVVTPTGNTLVENLTLKIEPGSNLLITGRFGWMLSLKFSTFEKVFCSNE